MLPFLLVLKILLFMNITVVKYNRLIVLLTSVLVILFCFSLIYLSSRKNKHRLGFYFYAIVSIIMFADIVYYSYFNTLPSIMMMKHIGLVAAVGDSVKTLLTIKNLLLIVDLPFTFIYSRRNKMSHEFNRYIRWGIPCGLGLVLILFLLILSRLDLFGPVTNQELFTYHLKDIKKAIVGEKIIENRELFTQEDLGELRERSILREGKYTGIGKGKNLILIQVEALQNFVIDHYYDGQEITPNLNALIEQNGSIYFNNYYQLIGRGNTADAEFVSNNSLYPSMEEPTYNQYPDNTYYGLPWILRENGYTAWAFHGYEKDFWNRDNAYINQGFQRFISEEDFDVVESIGFGITDEEFYQQSIKYIKELNNIDENPFYSFIISLTSHNPFIMPGKYRVLDIREEHRDTILGNYLDSIHYADRALGEFFQALKEEGLYDDSIIAIYGDHFAISSANKDTQRLMTKYLGCPYDLDEMMKVPLLIHIPGSDINDVVSTIGSQLDLLPTILNIMGYQNEKGIMFGRDLLNYEGENIVAPQTYALKGSVITDRILLEMSRDGIFENSRAIDLNTRNKVDAEDFRSYYEKAIDEINKSNFILQTDLLKDLIELDGRVNLNRIMSTAQLIDGDIKVGDNTIEDLEKSFQKGYKAMRMDFRLDQEEDIVIGKAIPIDEFKKWLMDNKGFYIVANAKENNTEILNRISEVYELAERIIPEIHEFSQYHPLASRKYKNIILNIEIEDYAHDELLEFIRRHPLYGVIMEQKRAETDLPEQLAKMGTIVYNLEGEQLSQRGNY